MPNRFRCLRAGKFWLTVPTPPMSPSLTTITTRSATLRKLLTPITTGDGDSGDLITVNVVPTDKPPERCSNIRPPGQGLSSSVLGSNRQPVRADG
jgi:hypothetical protein